MINRVELKNDAKAKLKGKVLESLKIIALLFLISFVAGGVFGFIIGLLNMSIDKGIGSLLLDILSLVISGLFSFGMLSFFVKISRGQEVTYKELFSKTDMWLKYITASLFVGIAVIIGFILLIVPGIVLTFGLSQTFYIILDNPEIGTIDAMKKSWDMMKGYKVDYLVLGLSFLGWIILGAFTFGILYIWLIPYMSIAQANFYNKIKVAYEQKNIG